MMAREGLFYDPFLGNSPKKKPGSTSLIIEISNLDLLRDMAYIIQMCLWPISFRSILNDAEAIRKTNRITQSQANQSPAIEYIVLTPFTGNSVMIVLLLSVL